MWKDLWLTGSGTGNDQLLVTLTVDQDGRGNGGDTGADGVGLSGNHGFTLLLGKHVRTPNISSEVPWKGASWMNLAPLETGMTSRSDGRMMMFPLTALVLSGILLAMTGMPGEGSCCS